MARIRQIKPEFWCSLSIARLPRLTRLHFVALWNYADDEGRGVDEPRLIKAACFPLDDDVTPDEIEHHQVRLAEAGRIVRYEVDGRFYFQVVNFGEHQYVSKKQKSRLPAPSQGIQTPPVAVQNVPVAVQTPTVPNGYGVRGQGTGNRGSNPVVSEQRTEAGLTLVTVSADADHADTPDPVRLVFDTWRTAVGKPRARLDAKRDRAIARALKTYPADDVLDAVRGIAAHPHNRGANDTGTEYLDITLALRDAEHIERFRDYYRNGPRAPNGHKPGAVTGERLARLLGTPNPGDDTIDVEPL